MCQGGLNDLYVIMKGKVTNLKDMQAENLKIRKGNYLGREPIENLIFITEIEERLALRGEARNG